MTCDQYVYINGEFAYRTDADGVAFIREQLKEVLGTASAMVIREAYHRDDVLPMGATGAWIRQAVARYGPIFSLAE